MDKEQSEIVEIASSLMALREHPGWKILDDYLAQIEVDRRQDVLDYMGTDPYILKGMQVGAKAIRDIRQAISLFMEGYIESARQILSESEKTVSEVTYYE